jgi:molybdenum cofactor cytidylyltransferase
VAIADGLRRNTLVHHNIGESDHERTFRRTAPAMRARPVVVVAAAGRGGRFTGEGPKLAQPLGDATVLEHTLARVLASGLGMVVVTTAALVGVAQRVVAARDIVLLPPVGSASREPLGMGYSIAAGVVARAQADGWLILPGDMPLVQPGTLVRIARELQHHPIVYPQFRGRRGHPVGIGAELYTELSALTGDEGARRLIGRYPGQPLDVDDPGVLMDVDTVDDLGAARLALMDGPAGRALHR